MLDRTIPPAVAPILELEIPEPEIVKFQGNLPALLIRDADHPIIYLELIVKAGKWYEINPGTSFYAAKMLAEGTADLTSREIAMKLESVGSVLDITPSIDFVSIKLYTLKKFFASSVEILIKALTESMFPLGEFQLLKDIRQQNIRNQQAKNTQFANLKFSEKLFGSEHPYGRVLSPEMASGVNLDAVVAFYKSRFFFQPKVILVGDFDDSLTQIEELTGALPFMNFEENSEPVDTQFGSSIESRGGSTQSSVRLGSRTIDKNHPDIHFLSLTNMLLGGFFGSRLMKNIREEKGLTYGIHSQIVHHAHDSYWLVGSEIKKGDEELVRDEIQKEIAALRDIPPSSEELKILRSYAKGKFLASFDSPFGLASVYKSQFINDLELSFTKEHLKAISSIQPEDVSEMAKKYLQSSVEVVVN